MDPSAPSTPSETPVSDEVTELVNPEIAERPGTFSFVPVSETITFENNELLVRERILFATDSAELLPQSFRVMDALSESLQNNPQISLLEVQAHRDPNPEIRARELTRDRAQAVVEALVQRGVDTARLRAAGWGDRCPLVHGVSERNRRFRLLVIEIEGEATGVELGCPASSTPQY